MQSNIISDALYNASIDCTHDNAKIIYGKGVIVGLICGIMAREVSFERAISIVCDELNKDRAYPYYLNKKCIPECWIDSFEKYTNLIK